MTPAELIKYISVVTSKAVILENCYTVTIRVPPDAIALVREIVQSRLPAGVVLYVLSLGHEEQYTERICFIGAK